jgi:hypothetical protein
MGRLQIVLFSGLEAKPYEQSTGMKWTFPRWTNQPHGSCRPCFARPIGTWRSLRA